MHDIPSSALGPTVLRRISVADQFHSEWAHILSHITSGNLLSEEYRKFATIPPEQRITAFDNESILQQITEEEVIATITGIKIH